MPWTFQLFPHCKKLSSHTVCEQAGDICTGKIIGLPTHFCSTGHVVTIFGFIKRHAHIFGKSDRPIPLNAPANELLEIRIGHRCKPSRGRYIAPTADSSP